ncbi:MAG: hypothetical protein ACQSGP_20295 [Frankia sp.]
MKVRGLAGALLTSGVLLLGPTLAEPASAAVPYPPTQCAGLTGILSASAHLTRIGGTVTFTACGFIPGRSVIIQINGTTVRTVIAAGDGSITFTFTFTFPFVGLNTVQAVGPAQNPDTTAGAALPAGASARVIAAADPTRVVTTTVRVLPVAVTPGHGGGTGTLPFTGAETGALAGLAVALTGGGVGLRVLARRRRAAMAGDGVEE